MRYNASLKSTNTTAVGILVNAFAMQSKKCNTNSHMYTLV